MNEALLCAAIFEQAITDYEKARKFLRSPHGKNKKEIERDIILARRHIQDIRCFAYSKEAVLYAGGSDRVLTAFVQKLNDLDNKYKFWGK